MTGDYYIDTEVAVHRPQTGALRDHKQGRSIHGYFGRVLTRTQALASDVPLCDRCFPQEYTGNDRGPMGERARRLSAGSGSA